MIRTSAASPCPRCGRTDGVTPLVSTASSSGIGPPSREEIEALAEARVRAELGAPPWIEHLNYGAALATLAFVCMGIPGGLSDALRYFVFAGLVMVGGATLQRTILKEHQRQADAYRLRRLQLEAEYAEAAAQRLWAVQYCHPCATGFLPGSGPATPAELRSYLLRGEYPTAIRGGPT